MQEFTISTLLTRIRQGWRTPVVFAVILVMFTLFNLIGSRPVYRVTMTVIPAPSDQSTQSLTNGGALSTILGLSSGGNVNFMRYQKLLSSTIVAQRLQDKYGMLQIVYRGSWDAEHKNWIPQYTYRSYLTDWLLRWSNLPTWTPPDITGLAHYLETQLIIVPSATGDILTIYMDGGDVAFSTRLMLLAHEQANQVLRDQVAERSRQQIAYLESKLDQTSVADYRAALLAILSNQQKVLMLTQTDASYAAEILSPPIASPTPVGPRPVLGVFVSVMVGTLSGLAVVIFLGPHWWRGVLSRISSFRNGRKRGKASTARG